MTLSAQQLLTVRHVASLMQVSEVHVRHLIRCGDIAAVNVGGRYRIRPAALERFLAANTTNY